MAGLLFIASTAWIRWLDSGRSGKGLPALSVGCFALALAVKPVMFPYPLGMLGLCSILFILAGKSKFWRPLLREVGFLALVWFLVILPTLPHFIFHRQAVFGYILGVAFESDFYKLQEEQGAQWSFHWLGYSGVWHLGGFNLVFALLVLLVAMLWLVPEIRQFLPGSSWWRLLFVAMGAFAGIAINAVHQPFFGMTFQLLLAAAALSALAHIFSQKQIFWVSPILLLSLGLLWLPVTANLEFTISLAVVGALACAWCLVEKQPWRSWPGILCAAALALLCWKNTQVAPYHNYKERTLREAGQEGILWRQEGPEKVWQALKPLAESMRGRGGQSLVIWFPAHGWVDANTVGWENARQGKVLRMFNESHKRVPKGEFWPPDAEVIVVPNPRTPGILKTPEMPDLKELRAKLGIDPHFMQLGSVGGGAAGVLIFQRMK
jgi:hypothetical protein